MDDIFGPVLVALVGAAICTAGYLGFQGVWKRARVSSNWARTNGRITRAWKGNISGEPGHTTYYVNYTFTAPETGGSYYGHSEGGSPDMKTGDDVEVMYDAKGPYNNELPMNRFERWFFPIALGILTVFGAALSITGIVATVVMTIDLANTGV